MALPSLLLVLGVALGALEAASAQLACADAARVGARALARGEHRDQVRALALSAAPADADVYLSEDEDTVRVTVRTELRFGPVTAFPIEVDGSAAAPLEPGS